MTDHDSIYRSDGTPKGRYALDVNSSVYGDPYVFDTPFVEDREQAEWLARNMAPMVEDAGRWTLVARALEELPRSRECHEKGWQNGSVWEQYEVVPGDWESLLKAVADRPGKYNDTDVRAHFTVTSEASDPETEEPLYQEGYYAD